MSGRRRVERPHILWAMMCLGLALLPHISRLSIWVVLGFGALACWRIAGEYQLVALPDRKHVWLWIIKQILAVVAFVAVYISYQGELGRDAGIALLTALLGLKMLELHNERDYYVVMFLAYFLVVTNFFYSQTLATAGFMLLVVITVTTGLVRFNTIEASLNTRQCFKLAAGYVAQAVPLMAVGFLLFPRIPGPLWGLPQSSDSAVTGLSEEMSIGHITELGVSDEVAFRVAFEGATPPAQSLYWRGPVMWETDGRRWRGGDHGDGPTRTARGRGPVYRYTVILEPHKKRWLFGIDAVVTPPPQGRQTSDFRILSKHRVKRRLRYTLASQIDYDLLDISASERVAALKLPSGRHPRARRLAAAWREQHSDDRALIAAALSHFNSEPFNYTLTPQALPRDSVDQFLFETREGFCEHYAAAFVTLMRAAGIPARVVTGYQGGEYNQMSDYMIVRQRDAHAWAEVFLDDEGWVRVDPTAAVAPERVSLGMSGALPPRPLLPMLGADTAAGALLRTFTNAVDALNYNWSQWVLGYSPKRQRQLLDDAGLEDWDYGTLIMVLSVSLGALTLLIALLLLRDKSSEQDPAVKAYAKFCDKLARAGLRRNLAEGPQDFAARVARARPSLRDEVLGITRCYTLGRYANESSAAAELIERVRNFHVPK